MQRTYLDATFTLEQHYFQRMFGKEIPNLLQFHDEYYHSSEQESDSFSFDEYADYKELPYDGELFQELGSRTVCMSCYAAAD